MTLAGGEGATEQARRFEASAAQLTAAAAGAVGAALVGGAVAWNLLERAELPGRLPMWDAAGNAWGAVELWSALSDGRLGDFLLRLNAQDKWPFGFSLLALPFVAAGGGSLLSAALLPALAFALLPALLVWAAFEIERDVKGMAAGLLAGALWLTSPLPRALATLSMRETVGAALAVAVIAAYLRARRRATLAAWRAASLLLLTLFLVKYNYFVIAAAGLALDALRGSSEPWRQRATAHLRAAILDRGWRSAARWAAIALVAATLALALGLNPGNFIYAMLLIATFWWFRSARRAGGLARSRAALRSLSPPARALSEVLVLPIWIWWLSPAPIHPRNVVSFLRNREGHSGLWTADSITFYPRELAASYLPPGWAGGLVAMASAAGLFWLLRRRGERGGVAATSALVAAVALGLHPLKESRFLATAAPLLFLVAALAFARGLSFVLPRRGGSVAHAALGGLTSLAILALVGLSSGSGALDRFESDRRPFLSPKRFRPLLFAVVREVADPDLNRVGFLGGVNQLSDSLVRWQAWRRRGDEAPIVKALRGLDGSSVSSEIDRRLALWLAASRPERVVALLPMKNSRWRVDGDFQRYNAWQIEAAARLEATPGWRRMRSEEFRDTGFELVVFAATPMVDSRP